MRLELYQRISRDALPLAITAIFLVLSVSSALAFTQGAIVPPLPLPADYTLAVIDGMVISAILLAIGFFPFMYTRISENIFYNIPRFLDDVLSNIRSGYTPVQAIERALRLHRYGVLGDLFFEAIARIKYSGVNPIRAFQAITASFPHPYLERFVAIMIEAYRAGPKGIEALEVASRFYRRVYIARHRYLTTVRGYISVFVLSFLVYIVLSYLIVKVFLPGFAELAIAGITVYVNLKLYSYSFYWLGIFLSIATGLIYGKIAFLSLSSGLFYAGILTLLNTIAYALFILGPITIPVPGAPSPPAPPT